MIRTNLGDRLAILLCSFVALPAAGGALPVASPQNATAVEGQWTWISGSDRTAGWRLWGSHGAKGVAAPGNRPGARQSSVSWRDASGVLWLFGGDGYAQGSTGYLNDLWRWDGVHWTWMSGSEEAKQPGVYGTKGVAAPTNEPGARVGSVSWTDASGGLWLFGGYGHTQGGFGNLNDLWKWDGTSWTWIAGSDSVNQPGSYGTKGIASSTNVPGARALSVSWTDASGSLWLFGGHGYGATGTGDLNDLWRWDGTNWTWMGGSNAVGQPGTYGTKGVPAPENVPGARAGAVSWTGAGGSLWLFGGDGYGATGSGDLNDLWKWDGTDWPWVSGSDAVNQTGTYGTKGVAAPGNVPGARARAVSWKDTGGNLWLFGGVGYGATGSGYLNDIWKWDGTSWTWSSGSDFAGPYTQYGSQGVPAPGNTPGGRGGAVAWTDATGVLWLFGGTGMKVGIGGMTLGDLWRWDGTNWMWSSGDGESESGTYGTRGVASPDNFPRWRSVAASWTDGGGSRWLFGGFAGPLSYYPGVFLNDLWKWDGTNWTWMSGSAEPDQPGSYGTKGVAAPTNTPGARDGAISWTDADGNLWLFGGEWRQFSPNEPDPSSLFNDLWKWDGTSWTWMSGSAEPNQPGSYGTKGVAAPTNVPGARFGAVSWTDATGNFWLSGGFGVDPMTTWGLLNDLWKWDGTNWTWVSGSDAANQPGTYGTKGSRHLGTRREVESEPSPGRTGPGISGCSGAPGTGQRLREGSMISGDGTARAGPG